MKNAILLGAVVLLCGCPKGGGTMSTETGGPGGGGSDSAKPWLMKNL